MKKLIFLTTFALTFLFSCKTILPPIKNDAQIDYVTRTRALIIEVYNPNLPSEAISYDSLGPRIDSIVSFNTSREFGGNILQQSKYLQKWFRIYKSEHEAKGTLSPIEIENDREYLIALIDPIIISEINLKKKAAK